MMVSRRRWRLVAVMVVAGILPGLAQGAVLTLPKGMGAKEMDAAHGKDSVAIRTAVIDAAKSATVTERDEYAKVVVKEFEPELASKNPDARLNTAILFNDLKTLSSDSALIAMLKNTDPSVRYWGARGLGDIAEKLKAIGPLRAITALRDCAKAEKSGVVAQEIIKALAVFGDLPALLVALESVSVQMKAAIPDSGMLQAAALGLNTIEAGISKADAADKLTAATLAAKLASFAAQQQFNYHLQQTAVASSVPPEYMKAVQDVVDAAVKVMGSAAGKSYAHVSGDAPPEVLLNLNTLVGAPGASGIIQKDMAGVPAMQAVKKPGT